MNEMSTHRKEEWGRAGAVAAVLAAGVALGAAIFSGGCLPADVADDAALTALSLVAPEPEARGDRFTGLTALPPGVRIASTPIGPEDTFVKSVQAMSGGTSGYPFFLVVNVDPSKIPSYTLKSTDPYWLQYYMKMWHAGKHARTYGPKPLPNPNTVYWMDQLFSPNGSYKNNAPVYDAGSYSWKFSAQKNNRGTYFSPIWYYHPSYFPSYFQANSGRKYVPMGTSDDGSKENTSYFWSYTSSTSYNTANLLYRFRIYTRENTTSLGAATTVERVIKAGQVAENGWAILPMTGSETTVNLAGTNVPFMSSVWVIVKPYNKNLYFNQNVAGQPYFHVVTVGDSTMKKVTWQGTVAGTQTAATSALLNDYINFNIAGLNTATFGANLNAQTVSFGGDSTPDYSRNGNAFAVTSFRDSLGQVQVEANPIPLNLVTEYTKAFRNVNVNGSLNSLKSAITTTGELSIAAGGKPFVLVYMAQSWRYALADETKVRSTLDLVKAAVSPAIPISVTLHSWSGHIGLDKFMGSPYTTLNIVNAAHGNFPAGGMSGFYSNISASVAPINLVVGSFDQVAQSFGGGQSAINSCVASAGCAYAWVNSGHSMLDALKSGAISRLRFY